MLCVCATIACMNGVRSTCELCGTKLRNGALVQCKACRRLARIEVALANEDVASPTGYRPGSPQKLVILANRLRLHLPLHFPGESLGDTPD